MAVEKSNKVQGSTVNLMLKNVVQIHVLFTSLGIM